MRKLDLRTMFIALLIFGLGFATCFMVFNTPAAMADNETGEITLDRLFVRDYIEFLDNGVKLIASDDALACDGSFQTSGTIGFANGVLILGDKAGQLVVTGSLQANEDLSTWGRLTAGIEGIYVMDNLVLSPGYQLWNVDITPSVTGGANLDVGRLDGYPAADFVLKSEIGPEFCEVFCPMVLKDW